MNAHRVTFHAGNKQWFWDEASEGNCHGRIAGVMEMGIFLPRTKGGALTIIPPSQITRIQIKPIRRRK